MTISITRRDAAALGGSGSILMRQRRDHTRLDTMMNRWLAGGTDEELDALWQDIVQLVFSHAFAEETVLWPVLRRVTSHGEELTGRVEEEHQAINDLVARVEKPPDDPRCAEWIRQAFTLIRQDIRNEEDELLPHLGMRSAIASCGESAPRGKWCGQPPRPAPTPAPRGARRATLCEVSPSAFSTGCVNSRRSAAPPPAALP